MTGGGLRGCDRQGDGHHIAEGARGCDEMDERTHDEPVRKEVVRNGATYREVTDRGSCR